MIEEHELLGVGSRRHQGPLAMFLRSRYFILASAAVSDLDYIFGNPLIFFKVLVLVVVVVTISLSIVLTKDKDHSINRVPEGYSKIAGML